MALSDQIMGVESGGDNHARNLRSTAYGPSQFLEKTWLDVLAKNRPDLAALPRDQQLVLRSDRALSKAMTDAYAADNGAYLKSKGFDPTPGNTYLAHFAGPAGAAKVLGADPATPAASVLGPQVAQANPFLSNMTTGELQAWANRKMGVPIPPAPIPAQPAWPAPAGPAAMAPPPTAPQTPPPAGPGMLAGADLGASAAASNMGLLASAPAAMAMASPAPPQPLARPMFRPDPSRLQAAALGIPPGGAPFDLSSLLGNIAPQSMTAADLQNWYARQNPTG